MLYGQKGTGKTFFALNILPKLFRHIDIEYIDMNKLMLVSNGFNDMDSTIKYLSSLFLAHQESKLTKLYVIDHLDWALPYEDSSEMTPAAKKIKQSQLLLFFVDLIDSKKYNFFFISRHYQNISSELAAVSRIDTFVQIAPPDLKKRKIAFEEIIKHSYNPHDTFSRNQSESNQVLYQKLTSKYDKICSGLASKTEHYKLANLIQIGKTFMSKWNKPNHSI
jgi:SpoVK/Ycf46/Vps4 family AAA+-type ATPase